MIWLIVTIAGIAEAATVIYFVRHCEKPKAVTRDAFDVALESAVWDLAEKGVIVHEDIDASARIVAARMRGLFAEEPAE